MTSRKLYIRTFGCQMNEYDSDKMADVLRSADGYEVTDHPEDADLILFNTCSVREKAQEKVFHDLGRVRHLKRARPDLVIGVGGCVASQEGAAIVSRAPYVDLVFGPQTLHRLSGLIEARRRTGRPQVDISFPEIEKFDHLPPARVAGPAASVSIMEGCSKRCSFCVVPYTRGKEVSRPLDDVLTEIADLAEQGVKEVTLLGQNVNAYRGALPQAGGEPGKVGRNWVERSDGSILELGGADKAELMPGDVFVIETPGGGSRVLGTVIAGGSFTITANDALTLTYKDITATNVQPKAIEVISWNR